VPAPPCGSSTSAWATSSAPTRPGTPLVAAWIVHLRGHGVPVTDARTEQVLDLVQGDLDEAVVRTLTWLGVAPDAVRAVVVQQVRDLLDETAR
jgi:fructuronate reductase